MHPSPTAQLPYSVPSTAPGCLAFLVLLVLCCGAGASTTPLLTLRSRTAVDFELVGYDGLAESVLSRGSIPAGGKQHIATSYQGLALLRFTSGPDYPVLLGDAPVTLDVADPTVPPTMTGSGANEFLYTRLAGKGPKGTPSDFALLLLRAKELLESTYSIRTVPELDASNHYTSLRHSDMVRRLIGQSFMMHEYVTFGGEGTPPADIRARYEQAVQNEVGAWLALLRAHIPEPEVLNYCLSLYYQRGMVTLAALIAEQFPHAAFCPGAAQERWHFPPDLRVVEADGRGERPLATIEGEKIIAFVSADCPVSLVATVTRARQIADQGQRVQLIVAPIQQLSAAHLGLNRMVHNGRLLFIDDEPWRNEHLAETIRLPLFVPLGDDEPSLPMRALTD
jgi:hypothetical protein